VTNTRERDAQRSRRQILDAAEQLFAQRGFAATSFTEICRAAHVSAGLPSYLFGDKQKLYRAVVERGAAHLRSSVTLALRSVPRDAALERVLNSFVGAYLKYLAANRNIVRLLQFEMLGTTQQAASGVGGELFEEGLKILKAAFQRVGIRGVEARHMLLSIVALCFYPFMVNGIGFDADPYDGPFVAARKRHVVKLLLKGCRA
jgi:TetR/AcrR family transcriptional regulator